MKKTLWQRFNDWRKSFLFMTASEAEANSKAITDVAFDVAKRAYEQKMAEAQTYHKAALDLFGQFQEIRMDVNGRSQLLTITLVLNRKTLRILDVEDASRLLAVRTEVIYKDAIQKRLADLDKTEKQKQAKKKGTE